MFGIKYSKKANEIIEKYGLNRLLLEGNLVPEENILQMPKYYDKIKDLFDWADLIFEEKENNIKKFESGAKFIGIELDKCEKELQKLWKFEPNEAYYRYWIELPGCKCPKIDNKENYGINRIINCSCPYHKHLCKERS